MSTRGWLLLEDEDGRLIPAPVRLTFRHSVERLAAIEDEVLLCFREALVLQDMRDEQIKRPTAGSKRKRERQDSVRALLMEEPELTVRQLARRLAFSRRTIARDIGEMGGLRRILAGIAPGIGFGQTGTVTAPPPVVLWSRSGDIEIDQEAQMGWVSVTLDAEEKRALIELAEFERRDPRDQAALLIRRSLEEQGLLKQKRPARARRPSADQSE